MEISQKAPGTFPEWLHILQEPTELLRGFFE